MHFLTRRYQHEKQGLFSRIRTWKNNLDIQRLHLECT